MATFLQNFNLFIPGKNVKTVEQPKYGTDMRTIEAWGLLVSKYLEEIANQFIGSFHSTPQFSFPSMYVGSTPTADQQLTARMFVESVTVTTGVTTVALSGFTTGYNALVMGASVIGNIYTLNTGSTLTSLRLGVYAGTSAYTGADTVSVLVVGA